MRGPGSIPRLIAAATAIHLAVGLVIGIAWVRTGNDRIIEGYFHYPGAVFLVGLAAAEFWLSWFCWRQFSPGEAMRQAWFLIMLSALAHMFGRLCSELLGVDSYLNLLRYSHVPLADAAGFFRQIGVLIGGPLQMALLAYGLAVVLRVQRQFGLLPRLTRLDWLLIASLAAYTFGEGWQVVQAIRAGKVFSRYDVLLWTSNPLLIALLFEAIWIRRSVLAMGWGLIARCWAAFVDAIALTAIANMWTWAAWIFLPWPAPAIGWYIWFLVGAAFAIGPAYQVEAFRRVRESREAVSVGSNGA
jgi:hypothetical protein